MASVTEKPQPTPPPTPAERAGEPLVDQHIRRTRRALKLVDLTAGLITLTIGVLAFLLTMALLEHWVIPGGWSDTARFALFGFLILGVAVYCWRTFLPLLRQSINPVYAAQAIEQGSPSLKNSLLNLLLLRNRKQQMSRQVLQAVEQQAAQRLAQVPVDSVVDRSAIVRLGYLLLAITAICVLYRILSPKDLFSSAGRVLMPWSEIATPSRVQILNVTPGDAKAARGEQLQIAAEVHGLEEDEPVRLLYSTADEQIVGQEIRMKPSAGGTQFSCRVPARSNQGGIQQDFSYWIEAGDARSPRYQVNVFARPTLVVNRLRYDYPAYTGYPSREVEHTGDISAVEGTRVTLFAQANKPIKTAHVDFEADGRRNLLMNANVQEATVTFPLSLRDDRRTPRHASYVLRYETTDGNQNQYPPKYEIDVQPDYSPEIQLLLPEEAMLEVAVNQEVNFEIEARDPDFALSKVVLLGKLGEEQVLQEELLQKELHTGKFIGKLRKTPQQMGLKAGDVLEYWAAAADNRRPKANFAYSAHRKLRVIGPWQGNEKGEKNDEKNQDGQGQQQPNDKGESGEQGEGKGNEEGQPGAGDPGSSGEGEEGEQGEGAPGQGSEQNGDQNEKPNQQKTPGESASADGRNNNDSQPNNTPNSENGDSPSDPTDSKNPNPQNDNGDQQEKVSPEGDDDSSAFERMAEHFKEQGDEQSDGDAKPKDNSDGKASDGTPDADQSAEPGDSENDVAREGEQSDNQEGAAQDRASEDEGAQGDPAPGEDASKGEQEGESEQQQGEQSPDEKMSPEQGEAGAGEKSGDEQGTPDPEGAKQPQGKEGDKEGEQSDEAKKAPSEDAAEAASKANDQSESDSEGSEGGDRSGGGEKGAGQQADTEGKGGAGENQAADDGAGKASEKGEGETGDMPGDQTKAEGKTGESSGDQKGNGSEQAGETASKAQNQNPPPGESASADGDPQPNANPEGGGTGNNTSTPPSPPTGETQPGDDANLDYARKQTDLILDRLDDQLKKQEVDKSLLEKLGWTQDELRRFVDRWKNLKSQDNKIDSPEANQQLNDALRSLGLQRNRRTGYQSKITQDKLRDLRDAYRGRVPLEYQEQVNRYIKGTATAQENQ